MPLRRCRWPTCTTFIERDKRYCASHEQHGRIERGARDRYYNQHLRDPAARKFYHSAEWERARAIKLAKHPVCQRCERAWSKHVHHVKPLRECTAEERVDQKLLRALCQPCHNIEEAEHAER